MSKRKNTKAAEFPLEQEVPVKEQLRQFHSIQVIGKQVLDIEKRMSAARKDEDTAKSDLRKAREKMTTLSNEREDLVAEMNAISTGKFAERLSFPPPPELSAADTGGMRERCAAIAQQLQKLPEEYEPEFAKLSDTEKRTIPKAREKLEKELEKLLKEMRRAIKDKDFETVVQVAGAKKDDPILDIKLYQFSDGKWADVWALNPPALELWCEDRQSAQLVFDGTGDFLDSIERNLRPGVKAQDWWYVEIFNEREASIARAVANIRAVMRGNEPKPSGKVLEEMQIVESRLRQLEADLPQAQRGEPFRILPDDQDTEGFDVHAAHIEAGIPAKAPLQESDVDAGGKKKRKGKAGRESTVGPLAAAPA